MRIRDYTVKIASRIEAGLKVANIMMCYVAQVALGAMMFLTVADVGGRYFLNKPVSGSWEIIGFLLIFASAWGLGYCQNQKSHIRVDIMIMRISSKRVRAVFDMISYLIGLFACSLVCWQLLVLAGKYFSTKGGVSETLGVPLYIFMIMLAIAIAFLILSTVVTLVHSIVEVARK